MIRSFSLLRKCITAMPIHSFSFCTQNAVPPFGQDPTSDPSHDRPKLKRLSQCAERALWAAKTIQFIAKAEKPTKIEDESLWEKLKKLEISLEGYELSRQVRRQFLKMFTEGVEINTLVFDQGRIMEGTQAGKKIIFCPNLLITKKLANTIKEKMHQSKLVCGGFGMSKTITLVMMWHLTSMISSFKYQAYQKTEESQELEAELEHLLKEIDSEELRYIIMYTPKYWYWSVKTGKRNISSHLKDIMLQQATQLSQKTRLRLKAIKDFKEFTDELKNQYPKEFTHRIMIDQINAVASQVRKWNYRFKDHIIKLEDFKQRKQASKKKKKILSEIIAQEKAEIADYNQYKSKNFERLKNLINLIKDFVEFGSSEQFILNTSMNIEDQLLEEKPQVQFKIFKKQYNKYRFILQQRKKRKYDSVLSLQLQGHDIIDRYFIPYHQGLSEDWGKIDFLHFLWFEIERRLIRNKLSEEKIQEVKKSFFPAVSKDSVKRYYRFLFCNRFFKPENSTFEGFVQRMEASEIAGKIVDMLKDFDSKCIGFMQENIIKFLNKEGEPAEIAASKKFFMQFLYAYAIHYQFIGKQSELMTFRQQQLNKIFGRDFKQIISPTSKESNKELIPYTYNKDNKGQFRFDWTAKEFIDLASPIFASPTYKYYSRLMGKEDQKIYAQDRASFGRLVQARILKLLIKGADVLFSSITKYPSCIKREPLGFRVFKTQKFTHFFGKQTYSIKQNMKDMLDSAFENPDTFIIGTPVTDKGVLSTQNPSFDFAYVVYSSSIKKYAIRTFDVGIGKDPPSKIPKAYQFFNQLEDISFDKFDIQHCIICVKRYFEASNTPTKLENIKKSALGQKMKNDVTIAFIQDLTFKVQESIKTPDLIQFDITKSFLAEIDNIKLE